MNPLKDCHLRCVNARIEQTAAKYAKRQADSAMSGAMMRVTRGMTAIASVQTMAQRQRQSHFVNVLRNVCTARRYKSPHDTSAARAAYTGSIPPAMNGVIDIGSSGLQCPE